MVIGNSLNLQQDVITLRLSHLSRSAAFREQVLARLADDEDPFGMKDFDLGGVSVGIVSDERDEFAAKLDTVLEPGAGDAYLEQEARLTAPGVKDNSTNRGHIWQYWTDVANANAELRKKKRQYDENALSQGSAVHFTGEYTLPEGSAPDIAMWEGIPPIIGFCSPPRNWWKLVGRAQ